MPRTPKPWFRNDRRSWFVTIRGKRHNLGPDREAAFREFHRLMLEPEARPSLPATSVAAVLDAFLEWTHRHRAQRTYEWYRDRCQWFIKTIPSGMAVSELKPYHVQQWVDANPAWSDGHKRGCITAIQRPMRWAEKMGHIDKSPLAHLEKPQQGRREQVITVPEYEVICDHFGEDVFRDLLTVAWETGARPQELLRVEARHVELHNSRWVFPRDEAKGKRRARVVYLTTAALQITKQLMSRYPEGPLFRNRDGRPWTAYASTVASTDCRRRPVPATASTCSGTRLQHGCSSGEWTR